MDLDLALVIHTATGHWEHEVLAVVLSLIVDRQVVFVVRVQQAVEARLKDPSVDRSLEGFDILMGVHQRLRMSSSMAITSLHSVVILDDNHVTVLLKKSISQYLI